MLEGRRRHRRRREAEGLLWLSQLAFLPFCCNPVQAEDATSTSSSNNNNKEAEKQNNRKSQKGQVVIQDFCRRNFIQVDYLSILCDTPGAYYYGSGAYRNSQVCMSGDKANLDISFRIPHGMEVDAIVLQVELGIYNQFHVVGAENLCQLPVTQTQTYPEDDDTHFWGDATECPHPGSYTLQTYYGVPSIPDYDMHYTPDVRLTFLNSNAKLLGCVTSGPLAIHKTHLIKNLHGMIALSISMILFVGIFGGLLYLSYRRKKKLEHLHETRQQHSHRYPYVRTLNDGQVVPLPFQPRLPRTSEDEEEDESGSEATPNQDAPSRPVI